MRFRRFWQTLGTQGVVSLLAAASVLSFSLYVWVRLRQQGMPSSIGLAPILGAGLALVPILLTWGRYKRSDRIGDADPILDQLLRSEEEYCLVLRPFGSDGEIVLRRGRGGFTLEQAIARAARRVLNFRIYAIVDQNRRLAPPGLVYMRAPHNRWRPAAQALIKRAHSIVMILPPGEDIRQSFQWEIEQITHLGVQSRVVIVLPPPDQNLDAYRRSVHQACLILAVFEGFAGTVDDVDPLKIFHWETAVPKRAIMLKYSVDRDLLSTFVQSWEAPRRMPARIRYRVYEHALRDALAVTRAELADRGFSARYP